MNKNFVFSVMMVMALVFGLTVVGCDNDTTSTKDTWSDLTDFKQLNGKWKTTYSQKDIPIKDLIESILSDPEMDPEMGIYMNMLEGISVTINADITLIIDTSDKTLTMPIKATATFSGENIDLIWLVVLMYLTEYSDVLEAEGVKVTPNDKKPSVTVEYTVPAEELEDEYIDEMLNSGLLINQSGTKIKVPADLFAEGTPELIFNKQK